MPTRAEEDAFLADVLNGTTPIAYDSPKRVPRINSMEELERHLPAMCEAIHKTLGSQNLEATYQRCLAMDLKEAGILVLSEVEIPILWRGKKVATRRADIIVRTPDGRVAVLELKALVTPLCEKNLQQLEYYMRHFTIKHGFLINFPHDTGFPDVDPNSPSSTDYSLEYTALCGGAVQRDATRSKGLKNTNTEVQITKAKLVPVAAAMSNANTPSKPARQSPLSPRASVAPAAPAAGAVAQGEFALTKAGTPCKTCLKEGGLCQRWHAPKET
jgi:GxxExxY protein